MKKWTIALLCAALAAGTAGAQAKGTTKTPEPAKPAPVAEQPRAGESFRPTAPSGPREGSFGAQLALAGNWQSQAATVGASYYLARDLELLASFGLSLSASTQKNNLTSTSTDTSGPAVSLLTAAMFESRPTAQTAWGWGPLVGFEASGSEVKSGSKENKGAFDLFVGAGVNVKYFVAPNVAFFANGRLLLDWTVSNTEVTTDATGAKTGDDSASGFSLSTSTSNIGIAVYLN